MKYSEFRCKIIPYGLIISDHNKLAIIGRIRWRGSPHTRCEGYKITTGACDRYIFMKTIIKSMYFIALFKVVVSVKIYKS